MSEVRRQRCSGCWRGCTYRNFKPLKESGVDFPAVAQDLRDQAREGARIGDRGHIVRGTVLGKMHEIKKAEWKELQERCPHCGQRLPETIEDFLLWAAKLSATRVRVALGWPKEDALRLKSALRYWELANYWMLLKKDDAGEEPPQDSRSEGMGRNGKA